MAKNNTVDRIRTSAHKSPASSAVRTRCRVAVIWIDWYAYHVARFQGLLRNPGLKGQVAGIEMVGGVGVHAGLKFREEISSALPVETLLPTGNWNDADKKRLSRQLWAKLNQLNPEVVLVPGYYTLPALAAAIWAKLHRKKSVLMTESTAYDHARVWWREALKKLLVRNLFDYAVAGGQAHRLYLEQLGFPLQRVARYYDVVDNAFFDECCREIRSSHRPSDFNLPNRYFLYVGRVAEEKSVDQLIHEYIRYRQAGGTQALVIVGAGPQLEFARSLASQSAYAADIVFPGLKSTAELPRYYAFASAFVIASKREPWGLVVNEAMASGLPVIVSDRCGCVHDLVVHGENGYAFSPVPSTADAKDQLAQTLLRFDSLTASQHAAMGRRSIEIISRFSPQAFGSEIEKIANAKGGNL